MKTTNTEELKQNGDFVKTLVWYIQHANSTEEAEEHVRRFLATSIAQAIAEERDRVRREIEGLEVSCIDDRLLGRSDEYLVGYNTSTERWRKERDDLLSSLDKPLTDKE